MKSTGKQMLKAVIFLGIFLGLFICVQDFLRLKDNGYKTESFYELERDTCDVVFLGSSTMLAVQPMELYGKYGITSYNLAQHGQSFALTYYSLVDAIKYQHPKVVVVDVHTIYRTDKDFKNEFAHYTLDNMPFGINRIQAVFDVIKKEERMEFLLPIVRYHTRWKELAALDFKGVHDFWRGTYFRGGMEKFSAENITIVPENETAELGEIGREYLEKIIQLCKDENISLVLTNMPLCVEKTWTNVQRQYNHVKKIAEENGIVYINYMHVDAGIDIARDFYNYEHLNIQGGLKISDHIGDYLHATYDLTDHRGEPDYAIWASDYEMYKKQKEKFLDDFYKRYGKK